MLLNLLKAYCLSVSQSPKRQLQIAEEIGDIYQFAETSSGNIFEFERTILTYHPRFFILDGISMDEDIGLYVDRIKYLNYYNPTTPNVCVLSEKKCRGFGVLWSPSPQGLRYLYPYML